MFCCYSMICAAQGIGHQIHRPEGGDAARFFPGPSGHSSPVTRRLCGPTATPVAPDPTVFGHVKDHLHRPEGGDAARFLPVLPATPRP